MTFYVPSLHTFTFPYIRDKHPHFMRTQDERGIKVDSPLLLESALNHFVPCFFPYSLYSHSNSHSHICILIPYPHHFVFCVLTSYIVCILHEEYFNFKEENPPPRFFFFFFCLLNVSNMVLDGVVSSLVSTM